MRRALIEIEQARKLIQDQLDWNPTELVSLQQAVGRTTAREAVSDLDSPPFDKSLVDGFAIADYAEQLDYRILETVTAGQVPKKSLGEPSFSPGSQAGEDKASGQQDALLTGTAPAIRIMTGCPIPEGASGVVMVEDSRETGPDQVRLEGCRFRPGQNILPRGTVIEKGGHLLPAHHTVRAHDLGALAEFGIVDLEVYRKTRVAVLATGDELVDPAETPGPGQIRNSNGSLLESLARNCHAEVRQLGVARDDRESLEAAIRKGLENDILVIAGGVSAGILDLIPQCLARQQVHQVFHKVNLKPGKPLWFGKSEQGTLVFGLPGNPVSALVCFRLFVEPVIRSKNAGRCEWDSFRPGTVAERFEHRGGRRTLWPAEVTLESGQPRLRRLDWKGSADQVTFLKANCLADLGSRPRTFAEGDEIPFLPFHAEPSF
ncbi:MAG: molybdopterin molybdotransferase MoeA [Planctomycetota bacterium]|nr:molybdopterin molybdotransferase MoeA [Planctomycetota bacterium]